MLLWYFSIAPIPAKLADEVTQGTNMQTMIKNVNDQATAAITSLGQINTNLQSYQAAQLYNYAYPELFQRVVSYTSSRVLYNGMSVSNGGGAGGTGGGGATLTISGYTHSLGDLGRYLQMMYTEPDASAISLNTGIPGPTSPNPDTPQTFTIPAGVTAKLPGYPHPITSYTVQKGRIISVNTGAAAGGQFGAPAAGGFQGAPAGGFGGQQQAFGRPRGFGGAGAFGGSAAGAATAAANTFDARHDGFPFVVALTLKQPLSPPSMSGAAAAGAATSSPGGPPGGFGGPPRGFGGPPRGFGGPPSQAGARSTGPPA